MLLLAGVWSCKNRNETQTAAQSAVYPTITVHAGEAVIESTYPVVLQGQQDIEIRPRIDGFIEAIYIDEGARVREGQSLFKINSPQAEEAVTNAVASVSTAKAQVSTAKLNVDRMRPLAEKGIISEVQLQTLQNTYEAVVAAQVQAEAALKNARATEGWATVTSPVNGVVGTIPFRQGSLVNNTNILTTIANTHAIYAYFSLNEKDLMALLAHLDGKTRQEKIEQLPEVTLFLADHSEYAVKGKIETISGVVNTSTGSASLRAVFPNPDGVLWSGTSGRIVIPHPVSGIFLIPQKATFALQDKTFVYKVEGDSVVQKVITVEALPDGVHYAVTGGLNEGDRIVTDDIATLADGKRITPQKD